MSTQDILQRLADEQRRQRVARMLPEGEIPLELIELVRDDFKTFLDKSGLSLARVSRMMGAGYSAGMLSAFCNWRRDGAPFKGDLQRITRGLNRFMETYARREDAPRPNGFIETEVARRMLNLIGKTIELGAMGLIYSDAGRGKTMTLQAAAAIYPGAVLVRALSGARSAPGFAKLLAAELKIPISLSTLQIQIKAFEAFRATGRPLLIDEAQLLSMPALEFVRDLHDATGIPIVMAGTKRIDEKTADNDIFFGQFSSRIALRYDVTEPVRDGGGGGNGKPLHTEAEIVRMFESDKVRLTDDGRQMLTKLANLQGFGGLRLCKQVVFVAAGAYAGQQIGAKQILAVMRSMHGGVRGVQQIERAMQLQAKVS